MADWDVLVGSPHLEDERFTGLFKRTPAGLAWSRMRVKAAASPIFEDLEAAGDLDELWPVPQSEEARIALDACSIAVPEWAREFEERFNEKVKMMAGPGMMPRFEIADATRGIRNVIIGLVGAPGGGKTCSALRLATGLANGGDIVLIDTEFGKSTEFAPRPREVVGTFDPEVPLFKFKTLQLPPPFSPERYRLAVAAAAQVKPAVLIIDNITDEMHGEGGQLAMKDNHPDSDKFGWLEPKRQHRMLMNKLRAHPWYVILTVRAKEKVRPANPTEKRLTGAGVVNEGWMPQCDGGLPYDCTTMFQLVDGGVPTGSTERPWKMAAALKKVMKPGEPFTEEMGRFIREWSQPVGNWSDE